MKKQLVPYSLSLELRELGFDEECFAYYNSIEVEFFTDMYRNNTNMDSSKVLYKDDCTAPLWQQAFDWLLCKLTQYSLNQCEDSFDLKMWNGKCWIFIKIMETRKECLQELIKLYKKSTCKKLE